MPEHAVSLTNSKFAEKSESLVAQEVNRVRLPEAKQQVAEAIWGTAGLWTKLLRSRRDFLHGPPADHCCNALLLT